MAFHLDEMDLNILEQLQEDGRRSNVEIARALGVSESTVRKRIDRMQHAGVIPVCYSNVAVEILADNAAPEAEAVYGALSMPFSGLVFSLRQYFSCESQPRRAK